MWQPHSTLCRSRQRRRLRFDEELLRSVGRRASRQRAGPGDRARQLHLAPRSVRGNVRGGEVVHDSLDAWRVAGWGTLTAQVRPLAELSWMKEVPHDYPRGSK